MGKIIFHPGIGKTATSAIQGIGVSLPIANPDLVCFSPYGLLNDVHNAFADVHPQFDRENYLQQLDELITFSKSRNAATVVSSEFLIRASAPHVNNLLTSILESGIEVDVVVAVRNYSDYLISSYLQAVKVQWGMKPGESLKDYTRRELDNIRLLLLIDQWARVLGDKHIHILDYDKFKGNFVEKFFDFIGATIPEDEEADKRVNPSIPLAGASVLLEFDKVCGDKEKRLNFINLLSRCEFFRNHEDSLRLGIEEVVKNTYQHDFERMRVRYNVIE